MATNTAAPDLRRKLKVKLRPDLVIRRQRYGGLTYYVVKDPVGLRYFRFREEELFLLKQLDGKNSLDDVCQLFVEEFRPSRISAKDLETFVKQVLAAGIATVDTPQIGQRLFERYRERQRQKVKRWALNFLFLKIPLFDPEKLLQRMLPYTRFLFTMPFFLLAAAFFLTSVLHVLVHWDAFMGKLPTYEQFFTWRNLLLLWALMAVVKVMHEFGHGLSCKVFGGEVHEMGILMLIFTPCLYCNVTDAWMLPNKWHRAIIGAAGMYVELILASFALWIWWFSEPGLVHNLAFALIVVCGITTVLFNANPLMRFDGYYILSDLIEIPNLRERSNKFLGNLAGKIFLGTEVVEDPHAPTRHRWLFVVYAVAAYLYRWVITISILYFLYTFLKPYKLVIISQVLTVAALFSLVVMPVYQMRKTLKSRWRNLHVDRTRMVVSISIAVALVASLLFIQFPMRVDEPMILLPRDATYLFVREAGTLSEISVKDGDIVEPGAKLGRLRNLDLEREYDRLNSECQQYKKLATYYRTQNAIDEAGVAMSQANNLQQQANLVRKRLAELDLRVPSGVRGTVFLPPETKDLGRAFQPGELFCRIGDPKKLEAFLIIQNSDTSLVYPGQRVWIKLAGHVGPILESTIETVSSNQVRDIPKALSNKYGGEVATITDPDSQREIPMIKSNAIQVPIDNPNGDLVAGVRGVARLDIGNRSIYWRIKRYLQQTFHFRM